MSKLDGIHTLCRSASYPGKAWRYLWGGVYWFLTGLRGDCSGVMLALIRRAPLFFEYESGEWGDWRKVWTWRPTANVFYQTGKKRDLVFDDPADIDQPCFVVKVKISSDRATHIGWTFGDERKRGKLTPTFESGDGHGVAAFHNVKRWLDRCPSGYRIRFVNFPHSDMGQISNTPTAPAWWDLSGYWQRGCKRSNNTCELKGALLWAVKDKTGLGNISTSGTAGQTFGPTTADWVKRFQYENGLRVDGVVTETVVKTLQNVLREKLG